MRTNLPIKSIQLNKLLDKYNIDKLDKNISITKISSIESLIDNISVDDLSKHNEYLEKIKEFLLDSKFIIESSYFISEISLQKIPNLFREFNLFLDQINKFITNLNEGANNDTIYKELIQKYSEIKKAFENKFKDKELKNYIALNSKSRFQDIDLLHKEIKILQSELKACKVNIQRLQSLNVLPENGTTQVAEDKIEGSTSDESTPLNDTTSAAKGKGKGKGLVSEDKIEGSTLEPTPVKGKGKGKGKGKDSPTGPPTGPSKKQLDAEKAAEKAAKAAKAANLTVLNDDDEQLLTEILRDINIDYDIFNKVKDFIETKRKSNSDIDYTYIINFIINIFEGLEKKDIPNIKDYIYQNLILIFEEYYSLITPYIKILESKPITKDESKLFTTFLDVKYNKIMEKKNLELRLSFQALKKYLKNIESNTKKKIVIKIDKDTRMKYTINLEILAECIMENKLLSNTLLFPDVSLDENNKKNFIKELFSITDEIIEDKVLLINNLKKNISDIFDDLKDIFRIEENEENKNIIELITNFSSEQIMNIGFKNKDLMDKKFLEKKADGEDKDFLTYLIISDKKKIIFYEKFKIKHLLIFLITQKEPMIYSNLIQLRKNILKLLMSKQINIVQEQTKYLELLDSYINKESTVINDLTNEKLYKDCKDNYMTSITFAGLLELYHNTHVSDSLSEPLKFEPMTRCPNLEGGIRTPRPVETGTFSPETVSIVRPRSPGPVEKPRPRPKSRASSSSNRRDSELNLSIEGTSLSNSIKIKSINDNKQLDYHIKRTCIEFIQEYFKTFIKYKELFKIIDPEKQIKFDDIKNIKLKDIVTLDNKLVLDYKYKFTIDSSIEIIKDNGVLIRLNNFINNFKIILFEVLFYINYDKIKNLFLPSNTVTNIKVNEQDIDQVKLYFNMIFVEFKDYEIDKESNTNIYIKYIQKKDIIKDILELSIINFLYALCCTPIQISTTDDYRKSDFYKNSLKYTKKDKFMRDDKETTRTKKVNESFKITIPPVINFDGYDITPTRKAYIVKNIEEPNSEYSYLNEDIKKYKELIERNNIIRKKYHEKPKIEQNIFDIGSVINYFTNVDMKNKYIKYKYKYLLKILEYVKNKKNIA
jgi:hypothetical protein